MGKWEVDFWENLVRIIQVRMLQDVPFPGRSRQTMGYVQTSCVQRPSSNPCSL